MRFRYNENKAAQAAAHLLKLAGGKLNHMVLIKLLYLSDRASLVKQGRPITGARLVSMKHGPVVSQPLTYINEEPPAGSTWEKYISPSVNYEVTLMAEPEADELSRYEVRVLDKIYERFGKMDKWKLRDWLHENIPEWKDPGDSNLSIEYGDVLRALDVSEPDIKRIRDRAELLMELGALGQ